MHITFWKILFIFGHGYRLQFFIPHVYRMALYRPTLHFYVRVYVSFVCRYEAPPGECYYNTVLYNAACLCMLFH